MMRIRGGCNTGAGSVRHSSRGGRGASARRRKAEAARCPSKAQGARQRRVGVAGTSSKCGEVQNESRGSGSSSKQTKKVVPRRKAPEKGHGKVSRELTVAQETTESTQPRRGSRPQPRRPQEGALNGAEHRRSQQCRGR